MLRKNISKECELTKEKKKENLPRIPVSVPQSWGFQLEYNW